MNNRSRRKYTEEHISFLTENYGKYKIPDLTALFNQTFNTDYTVSAVACLLKRNGISRKKKLYPTEQIEWIKSNYPTSPLTPTEFTDLFNKTFNQNISEHKLIYTLRSYQITKIDKRYTQEHLDWLRDNYLLYPLPQLTVLFNQIFNQNKSESALHSILGEHKIYSGRITRFTNGHTPHNKGRKQEEWITDPVKYNNSLNTRFTPETRPTILNCTVGTERMGSFNQKDPLGYVIVRTDKPCDDLKSHKYWKLKHHMIWEQHYGPVPKGHKIIFADGDRFNFDINNLICVSNSTHLRMNSYKYYTNMPEVTKAGIAVCESELAYYKLMKGE